MEYYIVVRSQTLKRKRAQLSQTDARGIPISKQAFDQLMFLESRCAQAEDMYATFLQPILNTYEKQIRRLHGS